MTSQRINHIQEPMIPVIGQLIHDNPDTINFGQGTVYYPPPAEVIDSVTNFFNDPHNHRYTPVDGIQQLKQAISKKLEEENHIETTDAWSLFVTAGSNMGFLQTILAITDPGDEIIQLSPYYFNHEMAIRMANAVPVFVETDVNYHPVLERIAQAISSKTKAVVTISPNNPTGAVYPQETLQAINKLCREHGIYHITDEAYEYFIYDETTKHYSPASEQDAIDHTISLFSLSKTYGMASWRIGYMLVPQHLDNAIRKIQDTNLICAPAISQMAAMSALSQGKTFCTPHIQAIGNIRDHIYTQLSQHPQLISVSKPQGAFYYLLELDSPLSSLQIARSLIEEYKVALIPGETFGIKKQCCLRLAYGALPKKEISEGLRRLADGLKQFTV